MKVAMVFGASRGIGSDICKTLSNEFIVVALSKTRRNSSNAQFGSIDQVVEEIVQNGKSALAIGCNVIDIDSIKRAVEKVLHLYKRIDLVIYNAGAIHWNTVQDTPLKKYDLMHNINSRGFYYLVQLLLPIFNAQKHGEMIVVSPPIYSRFIRGKTAYAMTKISLTILVLGLAMELPSYIKINTLWPATAIKSHVTDVQRISEKYLRIPRIFSDAIIQITKHNFTGKCLIDEDFLRECGVTDFSKYRCSEKEPPRMMPRAFPDLSVVEQNDNFLISSKL
jgi:NAD(P)-dependent dehydrogenase (short-subunit alcohol dehydrogenase family)